MGRILAIDYGTKRVGLAVTDPLQIIAGPLATLHSEEVLPFLKEYVPKENVEEIVLGLPLHADGNLSGPVEALRNFETALKRLFPAIPLHRVDERFTSKMASDAIAQSSKRKLGKQDKALVDRVAATIILQSFMDERSGPSRI
ncbi:MAG: Holliday junction resolvase RuvX [Bacteroidia bacterium]